MRGYRRRISRRVALKWLGFMGGGLALGGGGQGVLAQAQSAKEHATFVELDLKTLGAAGYGTDPNLIKPEDQYWPSVLSQTQLKTTQVLADLIVPREGEVPCASEVGVVDLINEWVSAPYPRQQADRVLIESGLAWLDEQSKRLSGQPFADSQESKQLVIVESVAYLDGLQDADLIAAAEFFARFRALVVGAFYTSPAGARELGYQGNVPIFGDYPGPSEQALEHLGELLTELDLKMPDRMV